MHKSNVKSGSHAVVHVQPTVKTGMVGPAARGATTVKGMTTRIPVEVSGQNRLGRASPGHHASGGQHLPGASYERSQRL